MTSAEHACVVFGGDVVLARRQHYVAKKRGFERVLSLPTLKEADLAIVNLECVLATSGQQGTDKGEGGPFYFRGRPEMLRILAHAGVHAVATANNHSGDYGNDALLEQLNWLRDAGFASAGTGTNLEQAFKPVICRAGNLNVALLSVDATQASFAATEDRPGTAFLPLASPERWKVTLSPLIAKARRQAHLVFIVVHWGPNYVHSPSDSMRSIGRLLIDLGSDAVLGSSAHVLHGVEIHNQRPIIYDAGNLLFDAIRTKPDDCGLFKLDVSSDGVTGLSFVPVAGWTGFSEERTGDEARLASERYAVKCASLGTQFEPAADGRLSLRLEPEHRAAPSCDLVPPLHPSLERIPETTQVSTLWQMSSVPADAACQPKSVGPLTLLGMRVWPKLIENRKMLWVETFWRTDKKVGEDLRIDVQATPVAHSSMRPWGEQADHDPCDWLLPTSRWQPGRIYRDLYGLRPPYYKEWENGDLRISVGLVFDGHTCAHVDTDHVVTLAVPDDRLGKTSPRISTRQSSSISGWSAKMLEEVTGGTWLIPPPPGWEAKSFNFSTELKLHPPSMYVAYNAVDRANHENYTSPTTETWDRHRRIPQLSNDKAFCGALVARPVPDAAKDFPLLKVDDPLKAALQLGRAARERFAGPVVGVTGTVGKSSTVAMVATMLGRNTTLTTQGNFNTRVGTVLTLTNLNSDYQAASLEIAQSSLWMTAGPITRVVRPTAAIVTSIEMSQPGSIIRTVEDVAEYKARIFDGLTGPRIAVLPDYIKYFDKIDKVAAAHAARTVIFGYGEKAEVRIIKIVGDWDSTTIDLQLPTGPRRLVVPVLSKGMAENAVGAFALMYAMEQDLDEAAARLKDYEPEKGRMQRQQITLPGGGSAEIFDDSFNAEVTSMVNAFELIGRRPPGPGGRRIAILGRIGYLGDMAPSMHASLAAPLVENKFDLVVTHGPEMLYTREKLPSELLGEHFSDAESLVDYIATEISAGDIILIKGGQIDTDFGSVPELLINKLTRRN